ncbi:hypothetical protein IFM89_006405 [Coptis chinensis]|uniref:Uncharacterized protein n=1 Tax=Coptis chinensis TaxID=261450 RepID=A0A835HRE1_9MAGN|nr:hypothetical protein IFM89_006405 [Coptis chinensis]
MVNRVEEENSEEGLGIGNFVDVAYGMDEELVGDFSGGDGSQAEDVEPPIVLEPDLEAIAACPNGKDPNHWAVFVRNESTAEDKEDPSRKHGRVDSWKKGHERRDGTILASAQAHYEQVEASHKRRKEASVGGECSVMEVDFDNDELSQVFGPDKGSRTRGISSNKSKKQLQRIQFSSIRHSTQQNLMNMFANLNPPWGRFGSSPNVSLLDRDGVVVAKGYIMTETIWRLQWRKKFSEADPERDQRIVFPYQISLKADEKDMFQFFSRAGKQEQIDLVTFLSRVWKSEKCYGDRPVRKSTLWSNSSGTSVTLEFVFTEVKRAGGVGMIIANSLDLGETNFYTNSYDLPSTSVGANGVTTILNYIKSSNNSRAQIEPDHDSFRSCLVLIYTHAMLVHLASSPMELETLMPVLLWVLENSLRYVHDFFVAY